MVASCCIFFCELRVVRLLDHNGRSVLDDDPDPFFQSVVTAAVIDGRC